MDRFDALNTYVAVVRAGSISAAAERLGVAKSAVSRRIADLEQRIGAQLLARTTRSLSMTPAGERFLERAERLLAELDEAEMEAASARGALHGRLRIAAPLAFGLAHLGPVVAAFAQTHPEVLLDIDFSDRQVDLVQDGFDLALRIAELGDARLVATPVTVIRHALVASPAYLARHGTPADVTALREHRAVAYSQSAEPGWSYRDPAGRSGRVAPEPVLRTNNGAFIRDAAVAGLGIANEPTFIVHDAIRSGALVPLLTDHRWRTLTAWAVHPPNRYLPERVRAFIAALVETFDPERPYWDAALALD